MRVRDTNLPLFPVCIPCRTYNGDLRSMTSMTPLYYHAIVIDCRILRLEHHAEVLGPARGRVPFRPRRTRLDITGVLGDRCHTVQRGSSGHGGSYTVIGEHFKTALDSRMIKKSEEIGSDDRLEILVRVIVQSDVTRKIQTRAGQLRQDGRGFTGRNINGILQADTP